jgi:hypothetical protein
MKNKDNNKGAGLFIFIMSSILITNCFIIVSLLFCWLFVYVNFPEAIDNVIVFLTN